MSSRKNQITLISAKRAEGYRLSKHVHPGRASETSMPPVRKKYTYARAENVHEKLHEKLDEKRCEKLHEQSAREKVREKRHEKVCEKLCEKLHEQNPVRF